MKYAYIIGVMTNGLPKGITASPTLGCFSAEKMAHGHIDLLKQDRKFTGGKVVLDMPCKWMHNGDEIRRVLIDRAEHGGYRETLVVIKYKLR